jgi:hypothetical protein
MCGGADFFGFQSAPMHAAYCENDTAPVCSDAVVLGLAFVAFTGEAGDRDGYDAIGYLVTPADGAGFKLDVRAGVCRLFQDKAQHIGVMGVVDSHLFESSQDSDVTRGETPLR